MGKQTIQKNQYKEIERLEKHAGKNVIIGLLIIVIGMIGGFIYLSYSDKGYLWPMLITIPTWLSYFFSKIYFYSFKKKIQKIDFNNIQFEAKAIELKLIFKNNKERIKTLTLAVVITCFMSYLSWHYYYETNLLSKDLEYTTGEMIGEYEYSYYVNGYHVTDKAYSSSRKSSLLSIKEGDKFLVSYSPLDYKVSMINFEKPTQVQLLKYQKELERTFNSNHEINANCLVLTIYEKFGVKGLAALFKYYSLNDRVNYRHSDDLEKLINEESFQEELLNCN